MKNEFKKQKKVVKGTSSAVLISLLIHVGLFLVAGLLVVFTVVNKPEPKFTPPPAVDRPKMKLKKPKVQVKKNSRPKATAKIVTKVNRANMPEIQLPEMSGIGDGLVGGGISGFDMMPELGEISVFGAGQTIGNDFIGTFYDFKRDRSGRDIPMDPNQFKAAVAKFTRGGWKSSRLARYYQSPKKLYTTTFAVSEMLSSVAPAAFGEPDTLGYAWLAHYKGQIVHPTGGRFRFWGAGDDIMIVRLNGKCVLNAAWGGTEAQYNNWVISDSNSRKYRLCNQMAQVGDWFTLEAGEPLDMEVILGEVPGGTFFAMLMVQEDGVEYERNKQNGPILPIFKTAVPTHELVDQIQQHLFEGEACITNGPVFCDYVVDTDKSKSPSEEPTEAPPSVEKPSEPAMRLWTLNDGSSLEAEYTTIMAGRVILKSDKEKRLDLPFDALSETDRNYIELINPPALQIDFPKKSDQQRVPNNPYSNKADPEIIHWTFGARVKQTNAKTYTHELKIEYFALAQELNGNKYILIDRQESSFIPNKENKRSHSFYGKPIELADWIINGDRRGKRYAEYLVTVTDERGIIIKYSSSTNWMFENLENLKQVPVGAYIDKTCTRTYPTIPKSLRY